MHIGLVPPLPHQHLFRSKFKHLFLRKFVYMYKMLGNLGAHEAEYNILEILGYFFLWKEFSYFKKFSLVLKNNKIFSRQYK